MFLISALVMEEYKELMREKRPILLYDSPMAKTVRDIFIILSHKYFYLNKRLL